MATQALCLSVPTPSMSRRCTQTTGKLQAAVPARSVQSAARGIEGWRRPSVALHLSRTRSRATRATRRTVVSPSCAVKKTFGSFDDMVAGSDVPLLVDFYATWCGPCQMIAPALAEVGASTRGRLKVVKIDTDKYPDIATKYQIQGLPTVILFKNGQPVDRFEGMMTAPQMLQRVEYFLHDTSASS